MKRFFETLHPDFKKLLAKKLRIVTTHLTPSFSEYKDPPSLEECFRMLGMCEMRLAYLRDVAHTVCDYTQNRFRSIQETDDLTDLCKKQIGLLQKLIRGHLYEMTKENKNGLCDSN